MEYIFKKISAKTIVLLMIVPYLILFFIFTVFPVCKSIYYSFTDYNVFQAEVFVGTTNYLKLFLKDATFLISIRNTMVFAVITGPVSYILCLMLAWLINDLGRKVRMFFTIVFYAPAISGAAVTIFTYVFAADNYGLVNSILMQLGFIAEPMQWFKDPRYVLMTIIIVTLWTSLGISFLAFIAGLQSVDTALYEAGAVEGVRNRWQELWFITLPSMKSQLMFGAIMQITAAFSVADITSLLAGFPSVEYAAHTIVNHLQDHGMIRFDFGYASAIATVLFVLMVGCNTLVQKLLSKVGN